MDVRESYDSAAEVYAAHLAAELAGKPLDRHLLNRFAEETRGRGLVADLGCGPGHVTRYLHEQGATPAGIDLSPEMIRVARRLHPGLDFQVGDMAQLQLPDVALAGVIAFYSIVHFDWPQLGAVLREIRRVLRPGGLALISFHAGNQTVHVDDLFGAAVSLDFRFHVPGAVVEALRSARLDVIEHVEREPYEGIEYPSRRCYLLARAGRIASQREPAMTRQLISSGSKFEEDIGYSRAVVDGDWVFVSGTTGFEYSTMTIPPALVEQTEQCFKNIEAALRQAGASLADVVRVRYILPDAAEFPECWPVLRKYLGEIRPAATMISAGLADPRMRIEIEVTARKRSGG